MNTTYIPSRLLAGETELLRAASFTRWMFPDLLQPATDFLKNLRLLALYAECSPEGGHRYLCWHPPQDFGCEIRSGRTHEKFVELDGANLARGWPLLTLHVNANNLYSAVWISPNHVEIAKKVLNAYGITPASRPSAA